MSEVASGSPGFRAVLRAQKRRVLEAVAEEGTIDGSPILRDGEVVSAEEYSTLVYELHHVHLPELEAAGGIEFDREEDTVRRGPRFDEARQLFAHADSSERR